MVDKKTVLRVLEADVKRPVSFRELVKAMGLDDRRQREHLKDVMRELARQGDVVRIKGGRFGLPSKMNLVVGILKCSAKGYGFVSPDRTGQPDVFVRQANMAGALHGDEVVSRIEHRKPDGRVEGSIIRVLGRANTKLIGRFELARGYAFVTPVEPKILIDVVIPADATLDAKPGMLVEAEILQYPTRNEPASGRVVEVLGFASEPGIDFDLVVRRNQLPREFPADVRGAARATSQALTEKDLAGRTDFRAQKVVTIDGEKAQDFDDAISIEARSQGGWRLHVHIADVSHYVSEGSRLDEEALARGTSVYFPGKVIPMLPEELSNGICSLNPRVDRLVLTAIMDVARDGEVVAHEFHQGVIRSTERMTYTAVEALLIDKDLELRTRYRAILPELEMMGEAARAIGARRRQRGSIDFDLPESEIVLNPNGEMTGIRRSARLFSNNLIEEFMIAANETVARSFVDKDIPAMYRIHEPPAANDVDALNETIRLLGYEIDRLSPRSFREVMEKARGKPEERFVNTVCLRTMRVARYQTVNIGHYGLASGAYTHFTSPIRRYPDLIVHRLLKEELLGAPVQPGRREELRGRLEQIAEQSSRLERRAEEAEREYIERKKVRFMADKVGAVFSGYITAVESFGFFVELDEYFVEGLVHLTSLADDYYNHDERGHKLVGEAKGRVFKLGERVTVQVAHVDLMRRQIDFTLVEAGAA